MSGPAAAVEQVLRWLSADQVRKLATVAGPCERPPTSLGGAVQGGTPGAVDAVARLAEAWRTTPDLSGAGVALALRVGLAGAERADARRIRPVWTGPEAKGHQRLTAAVLHELVADAQDRILLVSFAAHTLATLAADLQAAVGRGVAVDVLFETMRDSDGGYDAHDERPFGDIEGVRRWRWPVEQRSSRALLHAKALVIDGCRSLVGSANLTRRALTANLELGVLVEDAATAEAIEAHVRRLIDAAIVVSAA
jgi:phosphatidylserine/phosphatidylglycerophosphate/cardiolipin synthase-like enzyme